MRDGAAQVADAPAAARRAASPEPAASAVATWIVMVGGNDIYWRCEAPARAVGGKVARIAEANVIDLLTYPTREGGFPWTLTATRTDGTETELGSEEEWRAFTEENDRIIGLRAEFPGLEGAAVFARPDIPRAVMAKSMRRDGVRTVAEADDNYFCSTSQNIFLRQMRVDDDARDAHARAMASMDANVFSTSWLRDRYHREYRARFGKRGLPEMHVCRNSLPLSDWPERVESDGPVRVGFMGSPSHVWDVNLAYAAFHAAKEAGAETWVVGYNPADPDPDIPDTVEADGTVYEIRSAKSRAYVKKWAKVIDRHIGWVEPSEYHRAAIPFDIGLCPLLGNDYTLGKSDVKAIEYTASGAAVVAMNHPVYNTAGWVHEQNCLLAGSWRELAEQTIRLVRDPKLRYELVTAAQEMVATERNGDVLRDEWMVALAS